MHYNQQSPWIPHHSASLSLTPNGQAPPPRTRHTTLPGLPFQPQPPLANSSISSRHNIPASLTPGRRPSRDTGLQQQQTALLYNSPTSFLASPPHTSFYGDYIYPRQSPSSTSPPVPQKPTGITAPFVPTIPRPPVPPKPPLVTTASQRNPLYPQSIPGPVAGPSSRPMPSEEYPTDDKDIALALALSESEARQREDDILAQEEADLMKALEESRTFANRYSRYVSDNVFDGHQDSSDGPSISSQPFIPSSLENVLLSPQKHHKFPEGESFLHMITPTTSESFFDEEKSVHQSGEESQESIQFVTDASVSSRENLTPTPPLYNNAVSTILKPNDLSMNAGGGTAGTSTMSSPPGEFCRSSSTDYIRPLPGQNPVSSHPTSSPQQNLSVAEPPPPPKQSLPRRPSVANSESSSLSGRSSSSEQIPSLFTPATSVQTASTSPPLSFNLLSHTDILNSVDEDIQEEEEGDEGTGSATRSAPILTANQYVEPDMLMGVSMGFKPPSISTILSPMGEAMPNIITLPYGKAPIFHIQSPCWRHLLKLMARLSGTRVEPTLEALTVAKDELKLRTVIQFVKIHHSASEWRTVIYLTTDMPVPPSVTNSHKYTNGDVTVLPYSYTLSPLPQLLRDGADSPMAKYYVVPATNSIPYPTLPINFPNLAMYLQSAVQASRKAAHDSSSGLRRLALNIDSCYPRDDERPVSTDFSDTSRSLGGMFKRVINRGKTPRGRGGNEEIYDLVTPFVADEWG